MREKVIIYIKRFPITLLFIVLIAYLSLFTPPKIEVEPIRFADKWAHILMYCILEGLMFFEYERSHKKSIKTCSTLCLLALPIIYGGGLELAQTYCTTDRSGDWMDFCANASGCCIGFVLSRLYFRHKQ